MHTFVKFILKIRNPNKYLDNYFLNLLIRMLQISMQYLIIIKIFLMAVLLINAVVKLFTYHIALTTLFLLKTGHNLKLVTEFVFILLKHLVAMVNVIFKKINLIKILIILFHFYFSKNKR
jgi:hypothetical protein